MRIVIIGGGAAGCFAAANVPVLPGQEVVVLEQTARVMQKVKASGGGRCNVTHACFDVKELLEFYPRGRQLLRRTLHRFGPGQTVEWFSSRGVDLKTEGDGRMFPKTDDSQTIIECIWQEMMRRNVKVLYHRGVTAIEKKGKIFILHLREGTPIEADRLLVAAGGYPKQSMYEWLVAAGHHIEPPVPSLFTFNLPGNPITALMGVSMPLVRLKIEGTKIATEGPLMITHWGLSGPAVLKASAFAARYLAEQGYEFAIVVNWLYDQTEADLRADIAQLRIDHGRQMVVTHNPFSLPRRLWEFITAQCGIAATTRWGDLPAAQQNKLVEKMIRDRYAAKGKTTFKEEFVTCGGIALGEVNPETMESRIVPGLYFAGEVLDVDGVTGGFNFQHAWSSAFVAAENIGRQV